MSWNTAKIIRESGLDSPQPRKPAWCVYCGKKINSWRHGGCAACQRTIEWSILYCRQEPKAVYCRNCGGVLEFRPGKGRGSGICKNCPRDAQGHRTAQKAVIHDEL